MISCPACGSQPVKKIRRHHSYCLGISINSETTERGRERSILSRIGKQRALRELAEASVRNRGFLKNIARERGERVCSTLYHCQGCLVQFWHPFVEDKSIYEKGTYPDGVDVHIWDRAWTGTWDNVFFNDPLLKHLQARRLLDVGCGNGGFLAKAKGYGFDVWGLDLDSKAVEVAVSRRLLKNVFAMGLEDFAADPSLSEGFDVITFFAVMEHQSNPRRFIRQIKSLLKPDGMVAGSVPNRQRFTFFKRETWDFPPLHFTWWSKDALARFFSREGFSEISFAEKKVSFLSLVNRLEAMFNEGLGINRLKNRFKSRAFKVSLKEATALTADDLAKFTSRGVPSKIKLLKRIKTLLKMLVFSLPALLLYLPAVRHGTQIYFRCQLKG